MDAKQPARTRQTASEMRRHHNRMAQVFAQGTLQLPLGLAANAAHGKLVSNVEEILKCHRDGAPTSSALLLKYFKKPYSLVACFLMALLVVYFILTVHDHTSTGNEYQFRATAAIIEVFLVAIAYAYNARLYITESQFHYLEVNECATQAWKLLRSCDYTKSSDLNVPSLLSVHVVEVIRDGHCVKLPCSFVVEGDTVRLSYGMTVPVRIELQAMQPGNVAVQPMVFEEGDCLHPSLFPPRAWSVHEAPMWYFTVLDTPLVRQVQSILTVKRMQKKRKKILFFD